MLLPAETVLGRGHIFIVMITLPIFAAFIASIQQIAGTHHLIPTVVLVLVSELWVFMSTGVTLSSSSTEKEIQKAESKRVLLHHGCLLGAMVATFLYISDGEGTKILEYVNIDELFSPFALLVAAMESLSRANLTRVVSSDWVLIGLVRQRSDAASQSEQRKKEHEASIGSLSEIFSEKGGGALRNKGISTTAVAPSGPPISTTAVALSGPPRVSLPL